MGSIDPSRTTLLRQKMKGGLSARYRLIKGAVRSISSTKKLSVKDVRKIVTKYMSYDLKDNIASAYNLGRQNAYRSIRGFSSGESGRMVLEKDFFKVHKPTDLLTSLQQRTNLELEGINEAMMQQINRVISDGTIQGQSKEVILSLVNDRIDKIGNSRAMVLVDTEVIRANAEGALDVLEAFGITHVSVNVEWSTRGDKKVCPLCKPLEGIIMPIKKARGMFPRHPRCRCVPIPSQKKRNSQRLTKAVRFSKKAEVPKGKSRRKSGKLLWQK